MIIATPFAERRPEPPAEIVARVKQINPALGLRFAQMGPQTPYWALTWEWPENDPRRARIAAGELPPDAAFDLLSMLPPDCTVDQAYGYIVNSFRRSSSEGIKALIDQAQAYNANVTKTIWDGATEEAKNVIEVMGAKLFAKEGASVPRSYGGLRREKARRARR